MGVLKMGPALALASTGGLVARLSQSPFGMRSYVTPKPPRSTSLLCGFQEYPNRGAKLKLELFQGFGLNCMLPLAMRSARVEPLPNMKLAKVPKFSVG